MDHSFSLPCHGFWFEKGLVSDGYWMGTRVDLLLRELTEESRKDVSKCTDWKPVARVDALSDSEISLSWLENISESVIPRVEVRKSVWNCTKQNPSWVSIDFLTKNCLRRWVHQELKRVSLRLANLLQSGLHTFHHVARVWTKKEKRQRPKAYEQFVRELLKLKIYYFLSPTFHFKTTTPFGKPHHLTFSILMITVGLSLSWRQGLGWQMMIGSQSKCCRWHD